MRVQFSLHSHAGGPAAGQLLVDRTRNGPAPENPKLFVPVQNAPSGGGGGDDDDAVFLQPVSGHPDGSDTFALSWQVSGQPAATALLDAADLRRRDIGRVRMTIPEGHELVSGAITHSLEATDPESGARAVVTLQTAGRRCEWVLTGVTLHRAETARAHTDAMAAEAPALAPAAADAVYAQAQALAAAAQQEVAGCPQGGDYEGERLCSLCSQEAHSAGGERVPVMGLHSLACPHL